ncbi:MAG: hypothetical protein ACQESB_00460 [Elusimicrobiota bacterium]
MGIVEKELARFKLSNGEQFLIEYTSKNGIHIHVDSIQITMSLKEFRQFIRVVLEGRRELWKLKNGKI